jgi:hypothetical protein
MADTTFSRLTVDSLTVGSPHGPNVFVTPERITLHGRRGKPLAQLYTNHDVFYLTLYDHNGQACIRFTIDDHGQPEIARGDEKRVAVRWPVATERANRRAKAYQQPPASPP